MIKDPNNALNPESGDPVYDSRDFWPIVCFYLRSFKKEVSPKPSPKNPPKVNIK